MMDRVSSNSSLSSSRKAAPWQQYVEEDGQVFYVELNQAKPPHTFSTRPANAGGTCALCSTRSCRSCASEDTGYSSDTDALPTLFKVRRSEQSTLDLSSESLFSSKVIDVDDGDDGVSVDLLELDRPEVTGSTIWQHCEDEEERSQLAHNLGYVGKSGTNPRHRHSSSRTASLCERHSNKLSAPDNKSADLVSEHRTCSCGGQPVSMSSSRPKPQEVCKEVVLHVRSVEQPWDIPSDKVVWLETALGIVPGHVDTRSSQRQDGVDSGRIIIKGLVPDGPAARSKKLYIGDHIESINGKPVKWTNLDRVISSLHQTRKVRLTVTHPANTPADPSSRLLVDTGSILHALQDAPQPPRPRRGGDGLRGVCVLYMSMEGVGSQEEEEGGGGEKREVVYQFPKGEKVLSSLRGAFFTLDHLLSDGAIDSDVRMLTVQVDGCDINVACHKEAKDMLMIMAPESSVQSSQLLTLSNDVLRLMRLLYGSLEEAFFPQQHHGSLDDFLSFTFAMLQNKFRGEHTRRQTPLLGYMDYLPLPEDVGISIGNTLTEYESADFGDMSDSFYDCRRSFTVLGSMAFYKCKYKTRNIPDFPMMSILNSHGSKEYTSLLSSYLVKFGTEQGHVTCCHLPAKDAADMGVYLKHSGLLDLSTHHALHQMLVWREVFPSRLCHEVASLNSVFGYSEPHARWFIMVVGVNNTLLACLLEAGGCSVQHEGTRLPDPFYVDQARATLLRLQTPDIIAACESRLGGDGLPATTTADKLLSSNHTSLELKRKGLENFLKTTSSLAQSLHNTHLSNGIVTPATDRADNGLGSKEAWKVHRKLSIVSDESGGSVGSNELGFKNPSRGGRLYPLSAHNGFSHKPAIVFNSNINTCKLASGKQNSLLMFCQVNEQEGVLITSHVDRIAASARGSLHRQVVDNFCRCVTQMHTDFAAASSAKVYPSEGVLEDIQGDHSWRSCREEGVMFTCSVTDKTGTRRGLHSLDYWVVGRKFRNLHCREVYVCFQDSTPQNIVELAFRLSFSSVVFS